MLEEHWIKGSLGQVESLPHVHNVVLILYWRLVAVLHQIRPQIALVCREEKEHEPQPSKIEDTSSGSREPDN